MSAGLWVESEGRLILGCCSLCGIAVYVGERFIRICGDDRWACSDCLEEVNERA